MPSPRTRKPKSPVKDGAPVPSEPTTDRSSDTSDPGGRPIALALLNGLLVVGFLSLTFLLGVFPLNDTDFWWHLKTGDLIRQGHGIPTEDTYTFGAAGRPWVDLHWLFQVLISFGCEHVGVVGLNLAKCVVTTTAVALLLGTRRREAPLWVSVLVWLPALLLLGGRMYIRPETLTLLYLAVNLAVLERWQSSPRLAYVLPVVQLAWVNTQGLFVLGPIVIGLAMASALVRAVGDRSWRSALPGWLRMTLPAVVLVGLACLVNPYGLRGALFPLALLGTMSNPVFSHSIAELMPVFPLPGSDGYSFVGQMGFRSLPLQLHLTTLVLGALSFVVPILWTGTQRALGRRVTPEPEPPPSGRRRKAAVAAAAQAGPASTAAVWRLDLFRLLLFAAFSYLSLQATRNSHQFAAVAGAVTAWNFSDWAAAVLAVRQASRRDRPAPQRLVGPIVTLAALVFLLVAVGSGRYYAAAGEGRTIGLGEAPLWFPHRAVEVAGRPGMPDRFVLFHNGHAALYEYAYAPERKSYMDARLEVIGPELYSRYLELEKMIREGRPGWHEALVGLGSPGVLIDNVHASFAAHSATLMSDPRWTCVWFDPVAAVYVLTGTPAAAPPFDFLGRHFSPPSEPERQDAEGLKGQARASYEVGFWLVNRGAVESARPLVLHAIGIARQYRDLRPDDPYAWRLLALLESIRDPSLASAGAPVRRYRLPFDPVFDLSTARTATLSRRALELNPDDVKVLLTLAGTYLAGGLDDAALPLLEHLATYDPARQTIAVTAEAQKYAQAQLQAIGDRLGSVPPASWQNLDELTRNLEARLQRGYAWSAAEFLEQAYPPPSRTWPVADRIATLWLHLGEADRAREIWSSAVDPPRVGLQSARVAAADYAADRLDSAREGYTKALQIEPSLFEAAYGLACVERDAGRLEAARSSVEQAAQLGTSDPARLAAQQIIPR